MKTKFLISLLCCLTFIITVASDCSMEDKQYSIFIDNNSETVIASYLAIGENGDIAYPDTTLSFDKKWIGYDTKPGERAYRSLRHYPIVEWVAKLPQDTLSIFIFSRDILNKYSWSEIQSGYKILRRYDLGVEDIRRLSDKNGIPIITYPPTELMKKIKMYPPYDK